MTRRYFAAVFLVVLLLCAGYGLWPRFMLESSNQNISILADYREITSLAKNSGIEIDDAINILIKNGITGIMVSELVGDQVSHGIGQAEFQSVKDPERGTEGTIISIIPTSPYKALLNKWLRIRFAIPDEEASGPIFLPMAQNMLKNSGIIPDIDGLEAAKRLGLKIFYRPAPSMGHLADRSALMLRKVHDMYGVDVFTPSGEIVSGYPDVSALANVSRELGIPVAMVEFSRQMGEKQLNSLVSPLLMPLHSVTNEEMTSRRITRSALRDRLLRAAIERSVRLLLLRTAPSTSSNFKFNDFANEVKLLGDALKSHGFNLAWPEAVYAGYSLNKNIFASFALSAVLMSSLWCYLVRMGMRSSRNMNIAFSVVSLVLALMILYVPIVSRLSGALAAPLIAVEASLIAMDTSRNRSIIPAFIFSVIGGLSLASFFSVTSYMLRLNTFSGVKLTLLLPPVMVLLHDLKNRIHPESVIEFLSRPPLWGELMIYGLLLGAVGFAVFRSDNVANISGLETSMRESLEHMLVARPRTREVLIGYPSLLLWGFLVRNEYFAQYREFLRIGTVLGFSSVINSFCHFHTPLTMILLREFNGLWTGLIAGIILVIIVKFVVIPFLKFIRPLLS